MPNKPIMTIDEQIAILGDSFKGLWRCKGVGDEDWQWVVTYFPKEQKDPEYKKVGLGIQSSTGWDITPKFPTPQEALEHAIREAT